jgi:hypothetical protein
MKILRVALVLVLALSGCAHPKPQPAPPPPAAEKMSDPLPQHAVYPKLKGKPGDVAVRGCSVTGVTGLRADCLCRHASTQLDAADKEKQIVIICK